MCMCVYVHVYTQHVHTRTRICTHANTLSHVRILTQRPTRTLAHTTRTQVWVNKAMFNFKPTSGGETCNLFNGEDTIAVYACVV